jgi:hypothetical protein
VHVDMHRARRSLLWHSSGARLSQLPQRGSLSSSTKRRPPELLEREVQRFAAYKPVALSLKQMIDFGSPNVGVDGTERNPRDRS